MFPAIGNRRFQGGNHLRLVFRVLPASVRKLIFFAERGAKIILPGLKGRVK